MTDRWRDYARILLAAIRLFNGGAALIAPGRLARMLGVDPDVNPGVLYFIRLFGIRTVIIGSELLVQTGEQRAKALRLGILIHGWDTMAAAVAALSGKLPGRVGLIITLISACNTVLAVCADSGASRGA